MHRSAHNTNRCYEWRQSHEKMRLQQPAVYRTGCLGQNKHRRCCSRLLATPVQQPTPNAAIDSNNGATATTSRRLELVEFHDHHKTTYRWLERGESSSSSSSSNQNLAGISAHDELYRTDQAQQSIFSSVVGGQQLLNAIKSLYLPAGYPNSVTDDYLAYQLCTVPSHITGWLSISLTTSSLLKAVGVNTGPVGATAAAAAIKWIVKDGIGAAGRLLVGGKLGLEFDDDPRRWRMLAEALTTTGLALEIATAIFPQNFLLLASVGNFTKAVGKGMGKPVFRVIQTHFAAAGNVGAVAAKEEVWEVSAQLLGYALSVLLLQALQDTGNWQTVVGLWAVVQGVHVSCRYWALSQLRFPYLNQKRASILAHAHVRGKALPNVSEGNRQEPILLPASALQPCVTYGCSVSQAWGVSSVDELTPSDLDTWVRVYRREKYLLVWRDGQAFVVLKQGCELQQVMLRAMWQAAWLQANESGLQQQAGSSRGMSSSDAGGDSSSINSSMGQPCTPELLQSSVAALEKQYDDFVDEARSAGWNTDHLVIKAGSIRVEVA